MFRARKWVYIETLMDLDGNISRFIQELKWINSGTQMDFYKSVNFGECIVNNDLFAHKMRTIKLLRLERRMAFALSPKQA